MQKQMISLVGVVLGILVLVAFQMPSPVARFVACDVGQGDAILITKGSNQVLIDGGPSSEKILSCLARHMPFWDRRIELIVLTNTDSDHLTGLIPVIERYQLIRFVTADGVHASDTLERLLSVVYTSGTEIQGVEQGETITVGKRSPLTLRVLWPPHIDDTYMAVYRTQTTISEREQILGASAKRGNLNDRSVVLEWEESGYRTLLTGDSGFQVEKSLLATGLLHDVDLLKVGHHGSKYATSADFLTRVLPEIAIISVGAGNRYGHPTQEVLERLSAVGSRLLRTDLLGDIVLPIN